MPSVLFAYITLFSFFHCRRDWPREDPTPSGRRRIPRAMYYNDFVIVDKYDTNALVQALLDDQEVAPQMKELLKFETEIHEFCVQMHDAQMRQLREVHGETFQF